jgi:NAD+ diphosphatase
MSKDPAFGSLPRQAYSGSSLERAAALRGDDGKIAALLRHEHAGAYVIGGEAIALKAHGALPDPLFSVDEARAFGVAREIVFLGLLHDAPRFGIGVDPAAIEALKARADLKFIDLRTIAVQGEVDTVHVPPLAEAKAILGWHARHRFCPNCGAATVVVQAGWRRDCPVCEAEHFPRTDPVVIMLITDGHRCLLAHEHRYGDKMYSTLAGFIEPGEDIAHAVRREVLEETNIRVGEVTYHSSQPWPFPHSLMLGCIGRAETTEITIDSGEIAEARWFTRRDAQLMLERRHPEGLSVPGRHAIANALIESFVVAV